MAASSRIVWRLSLSVLLAAIVPLFAAILIAKSLVSNVSALMSNPRVGQELERSLGLYQDLARAKKEGMRFEADAIAAREPLRAAALLKHKPSLEQELAAVFPKYPDLMLLGVADSDGDTIAEYSRGRPVDEAIELQLEVRRPLTDNEQGPQLTATFTTPRARFDELENAAEFVGVYRQIERSRAQVERGYLYTFAALVGITMLAVVVAGALLARSVTQRIGELARATQAVGAGDLTVRVPVSGRDEITDLARAFNSMLLEVERSRARIEFLQRMGSWQEMARRLAHEIKNPLTPIQLAVQECHRKYTGDDPRYRNLLDTTLEIVEEEVGTLRRLVTEFSSFARLPRADLSDSDLCEFMREQKDHRELLSDDEHAADAMPDSESLASIAQVSWHFPERALRGYIDKQMLRRVLVNLVRNGAQAIRDAHDERAGKIMVTLREQDTDWLLLEIDDNGPGIPEEMRDTIFDPYVTTKHDGTGLGLSIVKKIIMEHGGTIEAGDSPLGGARMSVRLPKAGTPAALAAREPLRTSLMSASLRRGALPPASSSSHKP